MLPSPWRGALTDLSPIASTDLQLDAALRNDVGAADAGTLVTVSAADEAGALAGAEAVGARLDALVRAGALGGYDSPARFLPSPATQRARLAALPDAATLAARLAVATEGGALPATRLQPFVDEVQAARQATPFDRAALEGTPLAAAVDALLVRGDATRPWRALVNLQPAADRPIDAARIRAAIADVARRAARRHQGRARRDLRRATCARRCGRPASARSPSSRLLALLPAQRAPPARRAAAARRGDADRARGARASGAALGILHLVGLLLTVAIGSNYALFFDHLRQRPEGDEDTLASLLLANLTTVISFGLLATSRIPVLHALGEVVAPGALLCLFLSAAFIARGPGRCGLWETSRAMNRDPLPLRRAGPSRTRQRPGGAARLR